jgi:hypothetical protein
MSYNLSVVTLKNFFFFSSKLYDIYSLTTRSMIRQGVGIDVRDIFKGYPPYFDSLQELPLEC